MAEQYRYKFTMDQVNSVDLLRNTNKVLIQVAERNINKRTDSGIYLISPTDTDYNPAVHSDRYGIVYTVPPSLRFDGSPLSMTWETQMELEVGDEVWFDYLNSENCVVLECDDGNDYKMIDYENIYLARKDGELFPLNGYCLFSDYYIKAKSKFDPSDGKVDPRYGYVEHLAAFNTAYQTKMFSDHIDIQVGEKVMFGARSHAYYIEEERYKVLDKMYRPVQRRNVVAVMDGDKVDRLADGVVMVKPHIEKVLPSGIIVPTFRKDIPHFKAEVVKSNHPIVEEGQWVLCPKSSPLRHVEDGVEYFILNDEDIWFVWDQDKNEEQ